MRLRTIIILAIGGTLIGILAGLAVAQVLNPPIDPAVAGTIRTPAQNQSAALMVSTSAPTTPPATPTPAPTEKPTSVPATSTAAPVTATPTATASPAATTATTKDTAVTPTAQSDGGKAHYIEYTVRKGDILGRIAKKYHVSVEAILGANTIANPESLTVGDVLHIPQSK